MSAARFVPALTVKRMMNSDGFVRVVHGPVGSGKSSGCNLELPVRARRQKPGPDGVRATRFAVVRNTYRELEDTTRKTFEQWCGHLGEWREADFAFEIEGPALGVDGELDGTSVRSEILFRALDRPQDVKKLLSLEITGAYINELREVPKAILDGLTMRVGRYPAQVDGGPSWYGVWADTNPWAESSEYAELFRNPPEGFELFRQPSGLSPEAENIKNLPGGYEYYRRMSAGKDAEWIDEYVHGKNPRADKGSVYGELIAQLEQRGGVTDFAHPTDGVFVNFDLGVSDATAMWFWRVNQHRAPDLIDWYECTGQGADHYFQVLESKGYTYSKIWLPHDARARTFQTGISTLELFANRYPGRVAITPELSLEDGIGATRWMLEQPTRFHGRVAEGLKRVRSYRYEWDEERKVFKRKPLHDFSSHTADALRYVACVVKRSELLVRPPEQPKRLVEVKPEPETFDQMLQRHMRQKRQGRV